MFPSDTMAVAPDRARNSSLRRSSAGSTVSTTKRNPVTSTRCSSFASRDNVTRSKIADYLGHHANSVQNWLATFELQNRHLTQLKVRNIKVFQIQFPGWLIAMIQSLGNGRADLTTGGDARGGFLKAMNFGNKEDGSKIRRNGNIWYDNFLSG